MVQINRQGMIVMLASVLLLQGCGPPEAFVDPKTNALDMVRCVADAECRQWCEDDAACSKQLGVWENFVGVDGRGFDLVACVIDADCRAWCLANAVCEERLRETQEDCRKNGWTTDNCPALENL